MSERQIKHDRVLEYFAARQLDAVLLGRRCNFSWYTCGAHNYVNAACDVGNAWLLVSAEGARVFTTNIESPRLVEEELAGSGIQVVGSQWHDPAEQKAALGKAVKGLRIAGDAPPPGVDVPSLAGDFDRLRWSLTPEEIVRYRILCTDVAQCVQDVARQAQPGMTEDDLAGTLAAKLRSAGTMPWVLLVAGDDRVRRFRHPLPTGKVVEQYILLVTCAERDGLISACSRLASFVPLDADLAARHRAVAAVDAALILSTRPGAKLGDILQAGIGAYAKAGHGEQWRLHHQGGSCGYNPRELVARPGEQTAALADQPFAWNPSIAGTKSEDTVLCTDAGPQLLAEPSDWPTVPAEFNGQKLPRPDILVL